MQLEFKIDQQIITRIDKNKVVAKSKNYLYAKFSFCDAWQGVEKTAVFKSATGIVKNVIMVDDVCKVPHEVIDYPMFTVSVFGGDRITVNKALIPVEESGYEEGSIPDEPTPDVYAQLLEMVSKTEELAESIVKGESSRAEAETKRVTAEQQRAKSEAERVEAEKNRVQAEQNRENLKSELETLKEETETVKQDLQQAEEQFNEFVQESKDTIGTEIEKVQDATEKANEVATCPPVIGDNNNWYVWDVEKKVYVDTGIMARTNIVQTTGDSETEAMSQKATTEALLDLANKVAPSPASITIYADRWEQDEVETRWHQEVIVANAIITPTSKVDLQLNAEQITAFYEKSLAFVTENDNGVITVYCIGQKPENDYTIQATVSEVIVNG